MMSSISVENLSKKFKNQNILENLTLYIPKGKILVILGSSGSGKTTLLNLLAGFYKPENGLIKFNGKCVSNSNFLLPPEARSIGYVFQDFALWSNMTVKEHILFVMSKESKKNSEVKLYNILEVVNLNHKINNYPRELSGGESQRLSIARCLASESTILLMDEVLSNIDYPMRQSLLYLIKTLGKTTVYVTHNQEESFFLADILAILDKGQIVQYGNPIEVYNNPISLEAAHFTGKYNFIEGDFISQENNFVLLKHKALRYKAVKPKDVSIKLNDKFKTVIRPNNIDLNQSENGKAKIKRKFFLGERYLYQIEIDDLQLDVLSTHEYSIQHKYNIIIKYASVIY